MSDTIDWGYEARDPKNSCRGNTVPHLRSAADLHRVLCCSQGLLLSWATCPAASEIYDPLRNVSLKQKSTCMTANAFKRMGVYFCCVGAQFTAGFGGLKVSGITFIYW